MHYALNVIAISSALVQAVLGFNSGAGCCAPDVHTFEHYTIDQTACSEITRSTTSVTFNCGPQATAIYNFKTNTIHLQASSQMHEGLTIHGACMDGGDQIAHIDLHMSVPEPDPYASHTFKGLNRPCNLGRKSKPTQLVLVYYQMKPSDRMQCFKNPITPID